MANNTDFRKYMSPDFQASPAPALEWMPWQQDTMQQDATNVGNTIGQLRAKPTMQKGGAMPSTDGKAMGTMGAGGKGSL